MNKPEATQQIQLKGGSRPLSAFLMDIDNTLVDVKQRDYLSFQDTASEMGIPMLSFTEFVSMRLTGKTSREIGKAILLKNLGLEPLEEFLSIRHSKLDRAELFRLDTLLPGIKETLQKISQIGVPVFAATLRHKQHILQCELARLGIEQNISGLVTAGDIREHANRPYRAETETLRYYKQLVLKEALTRFHLTAGETAFVSDTQFDIEAGNKLGLITIAVETGYGNNKQLGKIADASLPSAASLPGLLLPLS